MTKARSFHDARVAPLETESITRRTAEPHTNDAALHGRDGAPGTRHAALREHVHDRPSGRESVEDVSTDRFASTGGGVTVDAPMGSAASVSPACDACLLEDGATVHVTRHGTESMAFRIGQSTQPTIP